jgi:hypothetical protein
MTVEDAAQLLEKLAGRYVYAQSHSEVAEGFHAIGRYLESSPEG